MTRFNVDAAPAELPAFLQRLTEIVGFPAWRQREQAFAKQIAENPLIEGYLDLQFPIERAMIYALRYRKSTGRVPSALTADAQTGLLYSFAGMITRIYSRLSSSAKQRLEGRLRGALKDDAGLMPLAFEMRTAAHLMAAGFDVEPQDLCSGGGFDFLATKTPGVELEIECKSVGADLGRKVHLLRQYQLGKFLYPLMRAGECPGIVRLAVATLPDRLFPARHFMEAVAATIGRSLEGRIAVFQEGCCSVSYKELPIRGTPFDHSPPPLRMADDAMEYCSSVLGYEVGHVMTVFVPRVSATVVAVRSQKKDEFLLGVYRQLREAAKQLSASRAGVICVQFRNITSAELRDIAGEPAASGKPTALQLMTNKFFDSPARSRVHTVAYVAPGQFVGRQFVLGDLRHSEIKEDAVSYYFTNKRHPLADDPRWQAFG
jgi:hypothetical protein